MAFDTRAWSTVLKGFRDQREMLGLVERVFERYAGLLFPTTSLNTLYLFPHETWSFSDDRIEVEYRAPQFVVRYVAMPRGARSTRPQGSDWTKESVDGLDALERCLHHLRWIVTERQQS